MQTVRVDTTDVHLARPDGPIRGAIVLVHEIWGLVPHIDDIATRLAEADYVVAAPDLLSEAGLPPDLGEELSGLIRTPGDMSKVQAQPRLRDALAAAQSAEFQLGALARLRRVVDLLQQQAGVEGRIAVIGFCFGGSFAFALAAADDRIRAAVPFYGRVPEGTELAAIRCPVLALYGEQDGALVDALPDLDRAMRAAHVEFTSVVYPDVGHAFFNDSNLLTYSADAAAAAWERTLDFVGSALEQE